MLILANLQFLAVLLTNMAENNMHKSTLETTLNAKNSPKRHLCNPTQATYRLHRFLAFNLLL